MKPLTNAESEYAVKAFQEALPSVYGVAEAIDEMLSKLCEKKIIRRDANEKTSN